MENLNSLFRNSLIYVVLGFLPPAVNFFLIPIYTSELSPEEYGIITLATLFQSVLVNLIGLGIAGAFSRYFFDYYKDKKKLYNLYSTAIISILFFGIIVTGALLFVGQDIFELLFKNDKFTFKNYGIWVCFTAIGGLIQSLILALHRNLENVRLYAFFSASFFILIAGSIFVGIVIFEGGAEGSIVGRMVGTTSPVILYLVFFFFKNRLNFDRILLSKMLKYGLPLVPYLLLAFAFNSIDKFIIERFYNLDELGKYGFAFLVASVVGIFINSIQSAVNPRIFKLLTENTTASKQESQKTLTFMMLVVVLIIIFLTSIVQPAIYYLINERYHPVLYYLPILLIAKIPRLYFIIYSIPLFFYHKTNYLPLINLISFTLGIIFHLTLNPLIGIYGACISVFLIQVTQFILALLLARHFKIIDKSIYSFRRIHLLNLVVVTLIPLGVTSALILSQEIYIWIFFPIAIIVVLVFILTFRPLLSLNYAKSIFKG